MLYLVINMELVVFYLILSFYLDLCLWQKKEVLNFKGLVALFEGA